MANWLSSAASVFRGPPAVEPQTFELRCSCGRTVGGVRASTYQQVTCPGCKERLFVLPASVYPRPKAGKSRPKPAPRTTESGRKPGKGATPADRSRPSGNEARGLALEKRPGRLVTPFRTALALILITGSLVTYGIMRSRSIHQADADYAKAVLKGREALKNRQLRTAAEEFRLANRALQILGRDDDTARSIRQLALETGVTQDLVEKAPPELLAEALQQTGDSNWPETFKYTYRDTWLVIDAPVQLQAIKGTTEVVIDFPMVSGTSRGRIILDAPILRTRATMDSPRRMIFAAQLDSLTPSNPISPTGWTLNLRPQTAFLWSNPATFAEINGGEPPDPATRKILSDQTAALHLPAWTEEAVR